jgi:hypothetical protein
MSKTRRKSVLSPKPFKPAKKRGSEKKTRQAGNLLSAAHPALLDAKRTVVIGCVNSFMDQNRPGWNHDLQGDTRKTGADYHFPPESIPLVLQAVRDCVRTKHFTFTITPDLVQTSAAGTLGGMKFAIYQVTVPM